jgi:hypothetical protein
MICIGSRESNQGAVMTIRLVLPSKLKPKY